MPKDINSFTIIITLEGIEEIMSEKKNEEIMSERKKHENKTVRQSEYFFHQL